MKRGRLMGLLLAGMLVLATSCSEDRVVAPSLETGGGDFARGTLDPQLAAQELVAASGWELDPSELLADKAVAPGPEAQASCLVSAERIPLLGDIVHYRYRIRVGSGPYDVIGLHRVVKETRPYRPLRTNNTVFLLHGDAVPFEPKFLFGYTAPNVPDEQAAAIYLAQGGVDVWGIDQAWTLVPVEATDFAFMRDWGLRHEVETLRVGLAVARFTRALTGSGFGRMNLLGYSSGAITGYAYLNMETQVPSALRHVKGYVSADCPMKTDDETMRSNACAYVALYQGMIDSGSFQDTGGILFKTVGELAATLPDDPSPIIPGFTNMQAALYFGAVTYGLQPFTAWYHYVAGEFDADGMPVGLAYTAVPGFLDFIQGAAPYEPARFILDYLLALCDETDVPWDDHLSAVTVPVLYLGAAGGVGTAGVYNTSLLASTDVSVELVRLHPEGDETLDVGHIDLWTAANAEGLFWQPLLEWLQAHVASVDAKGTVDAQQD